LPDALYTKYGVFTHYGQIAWNIAQHPSTPYQNFAQISCPDLLTHECGVGYVKEQVGFFLLVYMEGG